MDEFLLQEQLIDLLLLNVWKRVETS